MENSLILEMYGEQLSAADPWVIINEAGQIIIANHAYNQLMLGFSDPVLSLNKNEKLVYPELIDDIKQVRAASNVVSVLREIRDDSNNKYSYHVIIQSLGMSKEAFIINFVASDHQHLNYINFLAVKGEHKLQVANAA